MAFFNGVLYSTTLHSIKTEYRETKMLLPVLLVRCGRNEMRVKRARGISKELVPIKQLRRELRFL